MKIKVLFLPLMLALLLLGYGATGCFNDADEGAADSGPGSDASGTIAPDFDLERIDGGNLRLSSLRGKAVLVDFWDTWCPPCRQAMPHLQELSTEYAENLVVVGVAFGREGLDKVRSYVQETGLTFEFVLADQKVVGDFGGIQSIPTTYLIDAEGKIVRKWVGGQSKATYAQAIRETVGG